MIWLLFLTVHLVHHLKLTYIFVNMKAAVLYFCFTRAPSVQISATGRFELLWDFSLRRLAALVHTSQTKFKGPGSPPPPKYKLL